MSFRLIVRREAESDIDDALRWYEKEKPGLGKGFHLAKCDRVWIGLSPTQELTD